MTSPTTFTCPLCDTTTLDPGDAAEGYCGTCLAWTGGIVPMFARTFVTPATLPAGLSPGGLVVREIAGCGTTLVPITPMDIHTDNTQLGETHAQAARDHLTTCDCHLILLIMNDGDTGDLRVVGHVDITPEEMQ